MEFLRFGSSIPGAYWGCCAACIIQDFKQDPDSPASIEVVCGDSGTPITRDGKTQFLGKTWREIFHSRLRIGTFSNRDMPNHAFFAILTDEQMDEGSFGYKWLAILKETGFEFLRTVDNSVYTGQHLLKDAKYKHSPHKNHIFCLIRNIGNGKVDDPRKPPRAWSELGPDKTTDEDHEKIWEAIGPAKFYSEEELTAAGVPVTMAGRRSLLPQQSKTLREEALKKNPEAESAEDFDPFDNEGEWDEDCEE